MYPGAQPFAFLGPPQKTPYDPTLLPVSSLARIQRTDPSALSGLFTWAEYQTDLTTLRNTYFQAYEHPLRLGAIVLAYIYQVERRRTQYV